MFLFQKGLFLSLLKKHLYNLRKIFFYWKTIISGCIVIICDFHREQAWDRWLNKLCHGCSLEKHNILPLLRSIARSLNVEAMNKAIDEFHATEYWTSETYHLLQEYLSNYWFPVKEVGMQSKQ